MIIHMLYLLITLPLAANQPLPENPSPEPEIESHSTLLKQRALEQAMDIFNNPEKCKCLKYGGEKLIECMDYASEEEVRLTFSKMSYHARVNYLLSLNLPEYKRFLDAFDNEEQWEITLEALPPDERTLLPQTVLEQLIMIRDTWITCAPRKVGVYGSGKKDPHAHDIAAWRNKILEGYENMKKDSPLLWQWLDARFMEQKNKLFHERKKHSSSDKRVQS